MPIGGAISARLLRPNLLESQPATVVLETSTIIRFTFASRRLGVLNPYDTSNQSTPRTRMSALGLRRVSSAMGPPRENEFLRGAPPVTIPSTSVPDNSETMFTAFV